MAGVLQLLSTIEASMLSFCLVNFLLESFQRGTIPFCHFIKPSSNAHDGFCLFQSFLNEQHPLIDGELIVHPLVLLQIRDKTGIEDKTVLLLIKTVKFPIKITIEGT